MSRLAPLAALLLAAAPAGAAPPRDELLRVAPADAAIIVVVQTARDHVRNISESPFAEWLPTTAIGKKLLGSPELTQFRDSAGKILTELGTTPQAMLDDVLG